MQYLLYSVLIFLVSVQFSFAQATKCDSLFIQNIEYAPFNDTTIAVYVYNESSDIFGYPGFILYDANGDTVAKETVNYFGIGNFQVHLLNILPGVSVQENFMGTLELWSGFYSTLECTYNQQVDLCPDTTCVKMFLSLGNFGGAIAIETFNWDVKDLSGNIVFSGVMELTGTQQMDADSMCLPFGNYTVEINSANQPMGQVFYSTYTNLYQQNGPNGPYLVNNTLFNLDFYESCSGTSGIDNPSNNLNYSVHVMNDVLYVTNLSITALGTVTIYDVTGRLVISEETQESTLQFDLSAYPSSGIYIVNVNHKGSSFSKKFMK